MSKYDINLNYNPGFMNENMFYSRALYFITILTIAIWALLAWQHFHGGVPGHHLLADEKLPKISNWWGALLLPLLSALLLYRTRKRIFRHSHSEQETVKILRNSLYNFLVSIIFGTIISICFTLNYNDITGYMMLGLLAFAIFFPIYQAECLLGFVISMTLTFGAVIPTGFGIMMAFLGLLIYLAIRPVVFYAGAKVASLTLRGK